LQLPSHNFSGGNYKVAASGRFWQRPILSIRQKTLRRLFCAKLESAPATFLAQHPGLFARSHLEPLVPVLSVSQGVKLLNRSSATLCRRRVISSIAPSNSAGRSAGDPKQSLPASIAGNQKQLVSTGKQRNAVTGVPANSSMRPNPDPSDRCVLLSTMPTCSDLKDWQAVLRSLAKWQRNPHARAGLSKRAPI
jgi:hypothetical protein